MDRYDLIWSAGLFDYLSDRAVVYLLKRLRCSLAEGGHLIVGNFSKEHESRAYMEVVGDWLLYHRSVGDLLELGRRGGFERSALRVVQEPTGTNLFLIAN